MNTVWFVIGLVVGAAIVGARLRTLMRSHVTAVRGERDEALERLVAVEGERDVAAERAANAESDVGELKLAAARAEGEHGKQLERLRLEVETAQRQGKEKLELVVEAQETMRAVVKDAAGEAFEGSGKKVVALTEAALKTATATNRADFERERKNVEQLVRPMKEGLAQLGQAVDKLDRDRERQHAELGEQMRAVVTAQLQVRDEASVLSRALTQPKAAGDWGEFHLRRLVESAGMSELCDFVVQAPADDDGRRLRPDMLVKLPGEKVVVVDAKAPLAPYRDACAVTDPAQRQRHMQLFARGLKAHVKKLSAKGYADQFNSALDFAVMYLPGDHFFGVAVEFERSLVEEAVANRVLIATPVTFIGLLRTIAYSWQQEKVAETARDIAQHGCTLYERLCTYLRHVDKVSRLINSLADAQNAAVGSLERWVLPEARRFPELGAVGSDKQPPDARQVTRTARSVQAPELPSGTVDATQQQEKPALSDSSQGAEVPDGDDSREAA